MVNIHAGKEVQIKIIVGKKEMGTFNLAYSLASHFLDGGCVEGYFGGFDGKAIPISTWQGKI
jgi:hypothetical protein